jgi:hypothetical protein
MSSQKPILQSSPSTNLITSQKPKTEEKPPELEASSQIKQRRMTSVEEIVASNKNLPVTAYKLVSVDLTSNLTLVFSAFLGVSVARLHFCSDS